MEFTNPLFDLDPQLLAKDEPLFRAEPLSRKFLRRRVVFFMDGYRYAVQAVKRRWDIDFVFFEAGREPLKGVYLPDTLDIRGADLWWKSMNDDKYFARKLAKELYGMVGAAKRLARMLPKRGLNVESACKGLEAHCEYWAALFEIGFLWFAAERIKEKIDAEILRYWKDDAMRVEAFLADVYRPTRLPLSSQEQRDLLQLHTQPAENRERALRRHWKKYRVLSLQNIDDEPFDLEYYRGRLNALADPNEYETQRYQLDCADAEMVRADVILKAVTLPRDVKDRIAFVRAFMYLRTENIDHMMVVNNALRPIFCYVSQAFSLPMDAALNMTYYEIVASLKANALIVDRDILLGRAKNGYGYVIAPHASFLVDGSRIDALKALVIPNESQHQVSELKGQIAFPGTVRGIVRVIPDRRNAKELLPGEILVTAMTSPDFVPAMRIASAIVTNEGGVLCHAAIMSRELRKPCIIGTKIATEVLKDGDFVEVDAEKGVVRILRRA